MATIIALGVIGAIGYIILSTIYTISILALFSIICIHMLSSLSTHWISQHITGIVMLERTISTLENNAIKFAKHRMKELLTKQDSNDTEKPEQH